MANPLKNSTVQATLSWTTPTNNIIDLYQYWLTLTDGVAAALTNALAIDGATIHVSQLTPPAQVVTNLAATLTSAGVRNASAATQSAEIVLDSVLLIDSEPMTVTAIAATGGNPNNGYDLTLARGANQVNSLHATIRYPQAVVAAHPAGSDVSVLSYQTPEMWLLVNHIQPGIDEAVAALGPNSASKQVTVVTLTVTASS